MNKWRRFNIKIFLKELIDTIIEMRRSSSLNRHERRKRRADFTVKRTDGTYRYDRPGPAARAGRDLRKKNLI